MATKGYDFRIEEKDEGYVSSVGITFRWGKGLDSQSYTVSGKK